MNEKSYISFLSDMRKKLYQHTDAHLQFYNALLEAQLFLLLREETTGDVLLPQIREIESNCYVLVFDNEARLVDFCGDVAPYAAVSGRVLIEMLAGQDTGLAFNLNVSGSETLLPQDIIEWLYEVISQSPEISNARPKRFFPLGQKMEKTLAMLHEKLAHSTSLARRFFLCGVEYDDGAHGIILAITGANIDAEPELAKLAHQAFVFVGVYDMVFDVVFLEPNDRTLAAIKKQGIQLQFLKTEEKPSTQGHIPGRDPDKPPKLI